MYDERELKPKPGDRPDGALARAAERRRLLERERLEVAPSGPNWRFVPRGMALCIVGVFLIWLELTIGWIWYADRSMRARWTIKGWVAFAAFVPAVVASIGGQLEVVSVVAIVAGAIIAYTFVVDAAVAIAGRLAQP